MKKFVMIVLGLFLVGTATSAGISLSGSGQEATQVFALPNGLSIFDMRYSGSSNFIIWLLDHNGEKVELLANEIGSFSGRKALGVSDGDYLLDIAAHGPWSVDISQPNPDTAQSTPATFSGRGSQVSEIFTLPSGLAIFKLNHDGKRNFIVWLLDRNGNKLELLANEIGTFDGSKATNIRDNGEYCLDIKADGNWNIGVNQ